MQLLYLIQTKIKFTSRFFFPVCKALKNGMAGLFGPQSSVTSSHIQSICDTLEIPHMETRWDYRMKRDDYSVNLYPHPHALGQVCQIPNIKVVDTSPLSDMILWIFAWISG